MRSRFDMDGCGYPPESRVSFGAPVQSQVAESKKRLSSYPVSPVTWQAKRSVSG
jgi:hypothetical protein